MVDENNDGVRDDDQTPLDLEEMEEARIKIVKLHPLAYLPLGKVFPWFSMCFRCKGRTNKPLAKLIRKEFKDQNKYLDTIFAKYGESYEGTGIDVYAKLKTKKTIRDSQNIPSQVKSEDSVSSLNQNDIETVNQQSEPFLPGGAPSGPGNDSDDEDEEEHKDPYNKLGFGFTAYFKMLFTFMWVFIIMSVFMVVPYAIYSGEGTGDSRASGSLGNLGFSKAVCLQQYTALAGTRTLTCDTGTLDKIFFSGVIPFDSAQNPTLNSYNSYCGDSREAAEVDDSWGGIDTCSQQDNFDRESLMQDFNFNCRGKTGLEGECQIEFSDYLKNLSPECSNIGSRVYMQYSCTQPDEEVNKKRTQGLLVSCIGILCALMFMISTMYLSEAANVNLKLWDIETTTASDFTVEYLIKRTIWDNFSDLSDEDCLGPQDSEARKNIGHNPPKLMKFEQYIEDGIERKLDNCPFAINDIPVQVSNITFAFDNPELLALLTKRGSFITSGKFGKVAEVDAQIDAYKTEHKEKLNRPVTAFITFRTQEGYERALKHYSAERDFVDNNLDSTDENFLGTPLKFKPAPEPSNILWENRHVTRKQQMWRALGVWVIIFFILAIAFVIFVVLKQISVKNQARYPGTTDCEADVQNLFLDDEGEVDWVNYKRIATADKPFTLETQGTGVYQCYCKAQNDAKPRNILWDDDADICSKWLEQHFYGFFLGQAVSYFIIGFNIVIREVNIRLIGIIGYHTESQQIKAVMTSIFIATFFNTAILLLLTNANLSETVLSFLPLDGSYTDLTENWYNSVAPSLVYTMQINSVYIYVDFAISYGMKLLFRCLDSGIWCCKKKDYTKKISQQQFVNLYSGPKHLMHFKYAGILSCIYVTFMYGLALPILFAYAAFTFFNYYLVEKLLITYYYQKPPVYDERLNKAAISLLKWAPLLMMFFGSWIMSNKQIFADEVYPKQFANEPTQTHHSAVNSVRVDQALPLFIVGCVLLIVTFFNDLLLKCFVKMGCVDKAEEEDIDEKLGLYYECVSSYDRKRWMAEELYSNHKLGVQTISADSKELIRSTKGKNKVIRTCPNYEILSNGKYAAQFGYTPIATRNTEQEEWTSDLVTQVLFMGYARDPSKEFSFKSAGAYLKSKTKIARLSQTAP